MLLVRSEFLGLFVKTLTANGKYCRRNKEKFPQKIQTQLSQKRKTFSLFLIVFLKSASNSEYFGETHESHSLSISETIDSKRGCSLNV